jgi:hypothetical protein
MPYCPNPSCRHRQLTGEPAEYRVGVASCIDCGTTLEQGEPAAVKHGRKLRVRCPGHLKRQLWLTLAIVAGLGAVVGTPGLMAGSGFLELFDIYGVAPALLLSNVLQIGIQPFLFGFIAVEIVALIVPRLRRRRLNDDGLRRNMKVAAMITGSVAALFQGYTLGSWAEYALFWDSYGADPLPVGPGLAFRMLVSLIAAGGASLWLLAAALIDRYGVGRGFAVVVIAQIALEALFMLEMGLTAWRQEAIGSFDLILLVAIIAGAVLAFHYAFRYGDRLAGARPFALPTCGTAPYEAGLWPLAVGGFAVSFVYVDGLDEALALFAPGSWLYATVLAVSSAALAFPFSAMFNWRRRRDLASGRAARSWFKARLLSGGFLVALAAVDYLIARWLGPGLSGIFPGLFALLIAYVLIADWWTEVRARWRAADGLELDLLETHHDVGDALEALRRLDDDAGFSEVLLTGRRFRGLSYFLGPFVPMLILGRRDDEPAD